MKKNQNWNLFNKGALAAAMFSVASLMSCQKDGNIESNGSAVKTQKIPGQYIVVLNEKGDNQSIGTINAKSGIQSRINNLLSDLHMDAVKPLSDQIFSSVTPGFVAKLTQNQLADLKNDPRVAYIEQDMIINSNDKIEAYGNGHGKGNNGGSTTTGTTSTTSTTSTTTSTTSTTSTTTSTPTVDQPAQTTPWGVTRTGGISDGTGKTAWIIDSGVQLDHPDLNVDVARSKSFLSSTAGGNYSSPTDEFGHGTHLAGIIGAKNNGIGTVGVAPNASIVSLRVMSYNGSSTLSGCINAINYAGTYAKVGDVVNLSWGMGLSSTLDNAVTTLAGKGIKVTIAAGNSSADCSTASPAHLNGTNIYTVSAMDENGALASFSNYGSPVDYATPGTNSYSTELGSKYGYRGGTSMAAPYMAGILLMTNGSPATDGYISGDKDGKADPIAHK